MNEKNVGSNFAWIYIERITQQLLVFVVTMVLARLIVPEKYGIVSLVTIFITIANVFVEGGFGTALIQKKNAGEVDFSSALWISFFVSIILYSMIWFSAPFLEHFFRTEGFAVVFRVMGIKIVASSLYTVQQAYISRKRKFKLSFIVSSIGLGISAIIGIIMAYSGAGVWALVWQQMSSTLLTSVILLLVLDWHPKLLFSWTSVKEIFQFGGKMLISSLIDTLYNNLRNLIIGKKYSSTDLAIYNKGEQFPQVVVTSINSSISKLLLPMMSEQQDDKKRVKEYTRIAISLSSFVMAPMLVGMAVCAEDIILLILTEEWLGAVPIMFVMCIMYMFYPIHTANLQAIIAMGKSNVYMILEIIKKAIGVIFLVGALVWFDSVISIAVSGLIVSLIAIIINAVPNRWILDYKIREQLKDLLVPVTCAVLMGVLVFVAGRSIESVVVRLLLRVLVGMISYVVLSVLLNRGTIRCLVNVVKEMKNRKK